MTFISDESQITTTKPAVTLYNKEGNVVDEVKAALAKTETFENKLYHYVLRDGFNLVNIIDGSYNQNKSRWTMSMVSKECFDSYLGFLKTKKVSYFTNAERLSHGHGR